MIKEDVLDYLRNRNAKLGETVQYGWFIFRLVDANGSLDVETTDFKQMASFTSDFSVAERIHTEQLRVLESEGVDLAICNLQQYALVSKSYHPKVSNPFISRDSEVTLGYCTCPFISGRSRFSQWRGSLAKPPFSACNKFG